MRQETGLSAKTDEASISVSEEIHEQHLKAYLVTQGMEWKTWTEYLRPAEEAWRRQREAVNRFNRNLDYWLERKEWGVRISRHALPATVGNERRKKTEIYESIICINKGFV